MAVAVVVAVQASGPGIKTKKGDIVNASRFLEKVSERWRSELPSENISMSDDPGCYYVLDDQNEVVTNVIACGGARRMLRDDGHVWDTYRFVTTQNNDGEQVASSAALSGVGVTRPEGTLLTADGDDPPAEVEQLAAPELPTATERMLVSGEEVPAETLELQNVKKPNEGTVIAPGGTLTVHSVGTVPHIYNPGPVQAADGEELQVVIYSFVERQYQEKYSDLEDYYDGDPDDGVVATNVSIEVDGKQREIATEGETGRRGERIAAVASIPESSEADIVLASDGHEQRVDLATGEREADPLTDTYYRDVVKQDLGKKIEYGSQQVKVDGETESASYDLRVKSAAIKPYAYHRDLGYASKGKAWLLVTFTDEFVSDSLNASGGSQTWTVDVNGVTSKSRAVYPTSYAFVEDWVAVFEVPADVTTAKLSVKVVVNAFAPLGATRTLRFGPSSIMAKFPK